jgi:hypothetical protein
MPRRVAIDVCPPGTWCLSPSTGFFGFLSLILFLGFVVYVIQTKPIHAPYPKDRKNDTTIVMPPPSEGGDDRYTRAPQPQRFWNNGPEIPPRGALIPPDGGIAINVPTQGWPESYQQMGLLKQADGKLLPLYGRRVASRADRFNYYTRTDTYNPVPLPIQYQRKDCQDPVGCQELFDGDKVKIRPTGEEATATLYRFDGPLYVPHIL